MGFAFMHLVLGWLIGKFSEGFSKIKLSKTEWFFILFGAIFPDVDYLLDWTLGIHIHRTFTHSIFMVVFGFLVVYLAFYFLNKSGKKVGTLFALGIISHIVLDMIFGYPGVGLLWPYSYRIWFFGFMKEYIGLTLSEMSRSVLIWRIKLAIVDMGLGVVWIGYLLFKGKIKEF